MGLFGELTVTRPTGFGRNGGRRSPLKVVRSIAILMRPWSSIPSSQRFLRALTLLQHRKVMEHERSPDGELGPDRKRRRKVLSCMDCRRRKVQCDRALPVCGRCEKAGKPCSYEDDSPPQHASSTQSTSYVPRQQSVTVSKDVWDDMLNRLLHQERIIERLQTAHTSPTTPATVSIATPQVHGTVETPGGFSDSAAKERILFRGKGFETTFFGPSDARSTMTLVSHF